MSVVVITIPGLEPLAGAMQGLKVTTPTTAIIPVRTVRGVPDFGRFPVPYLTGAVAADDPATSSEIGQASLGTERLPRRMA
jgi:hypothetical protein